MGKSFKDMTKEELSAAGKKGGVNSGRTRAEKKMMKETLETLLSMNMKKGAAVNIDNMKNLEGLSGRNVTVQEAIILAQIRKALHGSVASAEWIRDTVGQRPEDVVNLNTDGEDMSINVTVSYGEESEATDNEHQT